MGAPRPCCTELAVLLPYRRLIARFCRPDVRDAALEHMPDADVATWRGLTPLREIWKIVSRCVAFREEW